jgi:pyruvate,water dikinase
MASTDHDVNHGARGRHPEEDAGEKYVVSLSAPAALRRERLGSKAATLARLLQAGFPVPEGFVVTVEAFDQFVEANGFGPTTPPEAVLAASPPEDVADALRGALRLLGETPLAVQSSGIAEDLPGASFAGQYETVLDVRGAAALLTAVRRCWASAFGARVGAYRAAHEQEGAAYRESHRRGETRICFLRIIPDPVIYTYLIGCSIWRLRKRMESAAAKVVIPPEYRASALRHIAP